MKGRGAGATPAQEQAILKAIYDLESDGGLSGPVDLPEIEVRALACTPPATRSEPSQGRSLARRCRLINASWDEQESLCLSVQRRSRSLLCPPPGSSQGEWSLIYTSKSRFDPRNPLGSRVDGTKPGIEGFFAAIFGVRSAARNFASLLRIPWPDTIRPALRTPRPAPPRHNRSQKKPEAEAESAAPAVVASSSPIQRTITANESFTVTQDVALRGPNPHVDNVRGASTEETSLRLAPELPTDRACAC